MAYTTKPSMFEEMRAGNNITWERFYYTYRALVLLRGRDLGLQGADIDELLQRVMLKFFRKQDVFCFDRAKGRFRDYFRRIVTTTAVDMLRERKRHLGESLEELPEEEAPLVQEQEERYEAEWRAHIFEQAMQEVSNKMSVRAMQAFLLVRREGVKATEVARLQAVSLATVYKDCAQVWEALKNAVRRMNAEY